MKVNQIISTLLSIFLVMGFAKFASAQSFPNPIQNNLKITAGIENRITNFRWSIAGLPDGTSPNILSELIYNPIHAAGFQLKADYRIFKKLNIRASGSLLGTYKGRATDIDYLDDNRTNIDSPTEGDTLFDSNNGKIRHYDVAASYAFLSKDGIELSAGAGYQFSKELFYLRDSEMPDLNTTYEARWSTAQFFLNANIRLIPKLYLNPELSYLRGIYDAAADWNQIEAFQHPISFIHEANSNGWNYNLNVTYFICKHIGLNGEWMYANWKTDKGIDRLFFSDNQIAETQMNGAYKKSNSFRLSATYTF